MQVNNIQQNTHAPAFKAQLGVNDAAKVLRKAELEILEALAKRTGAETDQINIWCNRFNQTETASDIDGVLSVTIGGQTKRGVVKYRDDKGPEVASKDVGRSFTDLISSISTRLLEKQKAAAGQDAVVSTVKELPAQKTQEGGLLSRLLGLFK